VTLSHEEIRKTTISALGSDDDLFEKLVLKGGNALHLIHGVGGRSSLDLDYSIEEDFYDLQKLKEKVASALKDRFQEKGVVAFDVTVERKPSKQPPGADLKWGGYRVCFKIIDKATYDEFGGNPNEIRRRALEVAPRQQKKFKIEISKFEYCGDKVEVEVDDFSVYVYSLKLIACEKLRAICQQRDDYEFISHPTARSRDFYDIWSINQEGIDLTTKDAVCTLQLVFKAKRVPFEWLGQISEYREFHRGDWLRVKDAVLSDVQEFDHYFDFVVGLARQVLDASRVVEAPVG
jgi:hypothetical protein